MVFLQPWMLWALPAVLVPVFIHLLNRLRYRTVRWAAIMFLLRASRNAARRARVRQLLLLLCRMLLIAGLIFAMGRPIVGGWLGWMSGGSPDTVLLLLDRSASMETQEPTRRVSRREQALRLFAQASKGNGFDSRFVLFDSAGLTPLEIADPATLAQVVSAGPSDTAADMPSLLHAAAEYIEKNRPGRTEIWIASDLQTSSWKPESGEWSSVAARIAALPQEVRVRIVDLATPPPSDLAVTVRRADMRRLGERRTLTIDLELFSSASRTDTVPLNLNLNGVRSQKDVTIRGLRLQQVLRLEVAPPPVEGGWGRIELPADGNARNNVAHFLYGIEPPLHAAVVAENRISALRLASAAVPHASGLDRTCEMLSPDEAETARWRQVSLSAWQAEGPAGPIAREIQARVEQGGVLVCFPSGMAGVGGVGGLSWSEVEDAPRKEYFRLSTWDEQEGPLCNTEDGRALPLARMDVIRRQIPVPAEGEGASWHVYGEFVDKKPLLLGKRLGEGMVFAVATLPQEDWSSLGDGLILVPMMQRFGRRAAEGVAPSSLGLCGEWRAGDEEVWTPLEDKESADWRVHAGLFRCGQRRVALNVPASEFPVEALDSEAASALLHPLEIQIMAGAMEIPAENMQSDLAPLLIGLAMLLMLGETILAIGASLLLRTDSGTQRTGATS